MKAIRFANNKTELAKAIGQSRTTLYRIMRLPDFPRPKADGRWPVEAVRKFVLKSAKTIEGPLHRDKLQGELLALKIRRATQELADFEQGIRDEITSEIRVHFSRGINILASRLKLVPRDLAAKGEGLSAQQIFKLSTDLIFAAFDAALKDFDAHLPESEQPKVTNVVAFEQQKAVAVSEQKQHRHASNGSITRSLRRSV